MATAAAEGDAKLAILNKLKREAVRLKTFDTWPMRYGYLAPRDLAKAGFFYFNQDCAVQCAFCLRIIRDWFPMDEPMSEHRRRFGNCPFVMGLSVGNIRLNSVTGREEQPHRWNSVLERQLEGFRRMEEALKADKASSDEEESSSEEEESSSDEEEHQTIREGDDESD
jgi:hypothetical protein